MTYKTTRGAMIQYEIDHLMTDDLRFSDINWWQRDLKINQVEALAEALKVNKTLKFLDLWRCSICRKGALALAEVLKVNHTIKISMGDNFIEPKLYKCFNK